MASSTIYKGTDIDIKLQLKYGTAFICEGVTFELTYFDSYNHGKIWKYEIENPSYDLGSNQWILRFPAQKQKFVGSYNVRCIVDMDVQFPPQPGQQGLGIQQVIFKHAFFLNDPIVTDDVQEVTITDPGVVETTLATLSGNINVVSLVQSVSYNDQTMIITVTFTNGSTINIDAHDVFPFRVVSELPAQIDNNVFYYTYEGTTETWTVATLVSPQGGGTVSGAGAIEKQTFCTLTATPTPGSSYIFVNWTVNGAVVFTANPYTFKPESDITVTANFSVPVDFDGENLVIAEGVGRVEGDTLVLPAGIAHVTDEGILVFD